MYNFLPKSLMDNLRKQRYHIVGLHSAVKRCRWLRESLIHNRACYKEKFYGVQSHRCVQMTPIIYNCTMRCLFCWRIQDKDLEVSWEEHSPKKWDSPEEIIDGCLKAQRDILSGYKGNPKTDKEKLKEAFTPKHFAISLAGEPTLYPYLSEFISLLHKKGFTSFLVTNGTLPEALLKLDKEPTQLYISLYAPDKETFNLLCRPKSPNLWEKVLETLSYLPSFNCKSVVRLTLVRHFNLKNPEKYAEIIRKAQPTYVEPKAYMHVGFSQRRLSFENMPTHTEIREFSQALADELGYNILDESVESRVVLLSCLDKAIKIC